MFSHDLIGLSQAGNANISAEMVGEVVGLVEGEMGSLEVLFLQETVFFTLITFQEGDEKQQIGQHFANSLQHMRLRRDADGSSLYQGLKL